MNKIFLLLTLSFAAHAQVLAPPPDPAALIATAQRTSDKFATTHAAWTLSLALSADITFSVDVLHAPPVRRLIFTVRQGKAPPVELARIIETPTTWYVTQDKRLTKTRPYEAEFDFPVISLAHTLAEPRFLTADDNKRLRHFIAREGDIARYALPPDNPAAVRNAIAQYDEMIKADPRLATDPNVQKTIAALRRALDQGVPLAVDTANGILAEYTTAKVTARLSDFHFIDPPPARELDVATQTWQDFTSDPTAATKLDDLAMIGHCTSWKPGQPSRDTECLLLNLATGQTRRIPFTGVAAIPGCFARDRSAVIISGMEADQSNLHLYEINLKTGVNRLLGGDTLAVGQTLMPTLSPDGRTIAASYKTSQGRILDSQVALIDLDSGSAKLIGKPFDGAFVNWLPDGKGFIVLKREYADIKAAAENIICRMDMNGTLTPICKGHSPVILGNALLFEHPDGRKWHLCDLDGKNPRMLGEGFTRHGFPSASPDAKRVLMMAFNPATGPQPVIVEIATAKPEAISVGPGLWSTPAWR